MKPQLSSLLPHLLTCLVVAISAILAGCDTGYERPINEHRAAKADPNFVETDVSDSKVTKEQIIELSRLVNDESGRTQIFSALDPYVLNEKLVLDNEVAKTQDFQSILDLYTQTLVIEMSSERSRIL